MQVDKPAPERDPAADPPSERKGESAALQECQPPPGHSDLRLEHPLLSLAEAGERRSLRALPSLKVSQRQPARPTVTLGEEHTAATASSAASCKVP